MDDIGSQIAAAGNLKRLAAVALEQFQRGDLNGAKGTFAELAASSRLVGNGLKLQEALLYEGLILLQEGDLEGALERFKSQESICRELDLRPFLVGSLGNQAAVLSKLGDGENSESALRLYEEVEGLCREESDERTLLRTLLNKGRLLYGMRGPDHFRAREAFRESVAIARKLGAQEELAMALLHEAECLDWDEVHEIRILCEEGLTIAQEVGSRDLGQKFEQFLELVRPLEV